MCLSFKPTAVKNHFLIYDVNKSNGYRNDLTFDPTSEVIVLGFEPEDVNEDVFESSDEEEGYSYSATSFLFDPTNLPTELGVVQTFNCIRVASENETPTYDPYSFMFSYDELFK